jgi:hypothetical protein
MLVSTSSRPCHLSNTNTTTDTTEELACSTEKHLTRGNHIMLGLIGSKNASQIQKRIVELEFPAIALMLLFLPSDLCNANTFPSDIKQKDPNKGNVKAGANIFQSSISSMQ